jgi:hypothetical protein
MSREAEVRGIEVQGQPGQIVPRPHLEKPATERAGGVALGDGPEFKSQRRPMVPPWFRRPPCLRTQDGAVLLPEAPGCGRWPLGPLPSPVFLGTPVGAQAGVQSHWQVAPVTFLPGGPRGDQMASIHRATWAACPRPPAVTSSCVPQAPIRIPAPNPLSPQTQQMSPASLAVAQTLSHPALLPLLHPQPICRRPGPGSPRDITPASRGRHRPHKRAMGAE